MQAVPKRLPLQLLNGWGKATEFSFVRVGDIFILSGSISSPSPQNPAQICTLPADALPAGDAIFTWLAAPGQCLRVDVRRSCADCCWWLGGPASELHANVVYTTQPGDPIVLANGWVPYTGAYATPSYFKQGNIVFLQGLTKDGDHNQPITTLPEGYRPQKKLIFTTNAHDAQCRIAVHPDGIVRWEAGSLISTSHGWIPLDNIFFSTLPSAEGEPLPLGPNWDSFDNNTTHSSPTIFVQDGFVFLSGVAKYSTNDNWDEIARIPQTLAPRSRLVFAVEHAGGTGRVEVDPEGRVRWLNNPTPSTDNWISLNGIFYFLEDAMTLFPVGPDEAITELYDASISDVPLYTPLVKHRCPRLLEEEIQERLQLPTATLRHLMRFVHQGSCGFKDDDGEHVFLLLEKSVNLLHLVQLEAECRHWLQQMIPRRPWDVLNLALKHGEKDVKQRVFLYVATHKSQFVGGQPLRECKEKVEDKDCALELADMLLGTPETDLKNQWDALPVVAPPGSRGFEADLLYLYNTRNETGDCEIVLGILDDVTDKKVKEQEEAEGKQSKRRAPVSKKGDEG